MKLDTVLSVKGCRMRRHVPYWKAAWIWRTSYILQLWPKGKTVPDLKLVRSLGCDLIQGYLIAKPMPVKDLLVWLANENNKKRAT